MLQELLEEEQREQEKQLQTQSLTGQNTPEAPSSAAPTALLSDHDFERLKADVLSSGPLTLGSATTSATPGIPRNNPQVLLFNRFNSSFL